GHHGQGRRPRRGPQGEPLRLTVRRAGAADRQGQGGTVGTRAERDRGRRPRHPPGPATGTAVPPRSTAPPPAAPPPAAPSTDDGPVRRRAAERPGGRASCPGTRGRRPTATPVAADASGGRAARAARADGRRTGTAAVWGTAGRRPGRPGPPAASPPPWARARPPSSCGRSLRCRAGRGTGRAPG